MRLGITGHQQRDGIDWDWVRRTLRTELNTFANVRAAMSSLAAGTDQVFTEVALEAHIPCVAVIPLEGYDRFFEADGLVNYRRLLRQCEVRQLGWKGNAEKSFYEAGKYIVMHCDVLFAVWDGEPAEGLGGTADIVTFAKGKARVRHINPIAMSSVWV